MLNYFSCNKSKRINHIKTFINQTLKNLPVYTVAQDCQHLQTTGWPKKVSNLSLNCVEHPSIKLDFFVEFERKSSTGILSVVKVVIYGFTTFPKNYDEMKLTSLKSVFSLYSPKTNDDVHRVCPLPYWTLQNEIPGYGSTALSVGIRYSMGDLVCDVFNYCGNNCNSRLPMIAMSELKLPMLMHSFATSIKYSITRTRLRFFNCCKKTHEMLSSVPHVIIWLYLYVQVQLMHAQ